MTDHDHIARWATRPPGERVFDSGSRDGEPLGRQLEASVRSSPDGNGDSVFEQPSTVVEDFEAIASSLEELDRARSARLYFRVTSSTYAATSAICCGVRMP